jgi:nucleoid DNA-binding protein
VNKSELIDVVAESADLPKAAAGRAIDAMIDAITDSLKKSDPVVLVGFGTFATKDRACSHRVVIRKQVPRSKLRPRRYQVLKRARL